MYFKFKYLNKIVGGFFILTCIIVIILLMIVARGQRWFQTYTPYTAYFDQGDGLGLGTPVMINGIRSGMIDSISLDENNRINVVLKIFSQYSKNIKEGSEIKIVTPLFGSANLEILPGPTQNNVILPKGVISTVSGEQSSLDALIEETMALIEMLKDPNGDLAGSLKNFNSTSRRIDSMLSSRGGTLGMLIESRDLYNRLISVTNHLNHLVSIVDESSPDIRDAITGAREGIKEANRTIRAVQKSIFIRGHVEKYLAEDSALKVEGRIE